MPVSAGVVGNPFKATFIALFNMTSQLSSATDFYFVHDLEFFV
jgi:hypothetical protein